jgi:hypothetical protein
VSAETKAYVKLPDITDFTDENGNDTMNDDIQWNYNQVKSDVKQIVAEELKRITDDPELQKLLKSEKK